MGPGEDSFITIPITIAKGKKNNKATPLKIISKTLLALSISINDIAL
jgi:hypothetical protein